MKFTNGTILRIPHPQNHPTPLRNKMNPDAEAIKEAIASGTVTEDVDEIERMQIAFKHEIFLIGPEGPVEAGILG